MQYGGTTVKVTEEVREKLARLAKHFKRTRQGQIEILIESAYQKIFKEKCTCVQKQRT